MGQSVDISVLGTVTLRDPSGSAVDLGGPRQRRLLAALVLAEGKVVAADTLTERLWHEGERPANADASVRTYVSRLRRVLQGAGAPEGMLRTEPPGYRLDRAAVRLDADTLLEFVAAARASLAHGDAVGALAAADAALDCGRGRPYGDLADEPWLVGEVQRLEEASLAAAEARLDALLALGHAGAAVAELERLCVEHPVRERFRAQLALALYRSGRQADALRSIEAARRRLRETAGLEPGPELRRLESAILTQDPALDLSAPPTEQRLRSYVLGPQLGEGAFAMVYRGTQPSVGRAVAIKVIRAELANRPEFIARFEAEAHLVARLEHPHVVPLYDYWREADRACLVMRLLRGGTLEQHIQESGPLALDAARRLVSQIGAALSAAHRAGVVHRDVKPANVFLDGEGNYYLGDFGIALEAADAADPESSLSAGSPAYASPEQLRRQPVGPPADVWGLGIVVYEALTGRLPFPEETTQAGLLRRQMSDPIPPVRAARNDVPAEVDLVLARATAKDASLRFQRVEDLAAALDDSLSGGPSAPSRPARAANATLIGGDARQPYKGLRPFSEADAGDFFGRVRLVDQLVSRLRDGGTPGRVMALVGPSGIGKSSVVRAGLLPALRRDAVAGSSRWFVASMVPGRDPFDELVPALLQIATIDAAQVGALLGDDHRGLARTIKAIVPPGVELLLLVDQFEELFTLTAHEAVRKRFLDAIEHAVTDQRCPLRLVLTLRADFYDRPLRYGAFARLLKDSTIPVLPLAPDELERAIVDPAQRVGAAFEPGLVSRIVADVADQPAALPILQYALTELYEQRVSDLLTVSAYERLGGVTGSLARRAEDVFAAGSSQEQAATRRLFSRLVTLGEGIEDTRRRVSMAELPDRDALDAVVQRFGDARLLAFDREPVSREPTVEVAHEALLREWPRLRGWLDADRDGLRLQRAVSEAARSWQQGGHDAGELYRGARLDAALEWAVAHPVEFNPAEQAFLDASAAGRNADVARERARLRRLHQLLAGVAAALVVALVAGGLALAQQRRASRNADLAALRAADAETERDRAAQLAVRADAATKVSDTNRLVAQSRIASENDRNLAMLLALEANRFEDSPSTQGALLGSLLAEPRLVGTYAASAPAGYVAYQPDGTVVGVAIDGTVSRFDRQTHQQIGSSWKPSDMAVNLFLSSGFVAIGADRVVFTNQARQARVYDLVTGRPLSPLLTTPWPPYAASVAFSPDGGTLYLGGGVGLTSGQGYGEIIALDVATGAAIGSPLRAHSTRVGQLALSPDGRWLVAAGYDRTASVWDLQSGTLAAMLGGVHQASVAWVAISADARYIATSSLDPVQIYLWDRATGQVVAGPLQSGTFGAAVAFSPDGSMLADFSGADRELRIWSVPAGKLLAKISDTQGIGGWVRFAPDGQSVLTGGQVAREWSVGTRLSLGSVLPAEGTGRTILSRDGTIAAVSVPGKGVRLMRTATGEQIGTTIVGPPPDPRWAPFPSDAAFDGRGGVYINWNGRVQRYNEQTAEADGPPMMDSRLTATYGMDLSPDGRRLAVGSANAVAVVFDLATQRSLAMPNLVATTTGSAVRFDASGRYLLIYVLSYGHFVVDVETGRVVAKDPAGLNLASAADRKENIGFDTATSRFVYTDPVTLKPTRPPVAVFSSGSAGGQTVSPDGRWLVANSRAGSQLYDAATARAVGPPMPSVANILTGPASFSADGRFLGVARAEGGGYVWQVDPDLWRQRACEIAGRNLTAAEWAQYLPNSGTHRKTCDQWALPA